MFEPGHLHRGNPFASAERPVFSIDLYYEVRQDAKEGPMLHGRLVGEIEGNILRSRSTIAGPKVLMKNASSRISSVVRSIGASGASSFTASASCGTSKPLSKSS